MSSPLSMLRKTRRAPLQGPLKEHRGRQMVPFRRNLLKEFQAELTDDEESSGSNPPLESHSLASISKSKVPSKKGVPPSDFELMAAMMQRVTLLEKTVRSQAQQIERKDKMISVLEEKVKPLEESEIRHNQSGRDELEKRCQQLQNQVWKMESFLNDYGLIWVGDRESRDSAESGQPHEVEKGLCQPDPTAMRSFHMNFDLVLQRIKELNVLAGEGESFVRSTATGAQLARKDPVQLSLYSNGIVMFEGPFRSYQEHSTQQCMQDLMDGYFPSELQERFPDGIPFEVHDRRDEKFIFKLPWKKYPGEGQSIHGGQKVSVDQFQNRLPKVVIKAGRVIDIRGSLRDTLQGSRKTQSSSSVTRIDTAALQAVKERWQLFGPGKPASASDVITLKVKSEDGSRNFILQMFFSETIGQLRQYLDKHRGGGFSGYDIFSARPLLCYNDNSQTLQSCGLTTNTALLLRKRKRPHSQTEVNKLKL